ncbi:MAG: GntR family transcriptional regulator [Pseudomonadota bacterium]
MKLHATILDPETRVPLYQQIYVILRNQILSGRLAPGDLVMGEQGICAEFGVSRITARRALNELALTGFVERRRGRGTVVLAAAALPVVTSLDGLFENVGHIGRTTTVTVLENRRVRAGREVAVALGIDPEDIVVRAVRVRHLADIPMAFLVTAVPEEIGARIAGQDMSRTPLLLLLEEAGVAVDAAHQTITATIADPEVSVALGVPAGAPLIDVRRTVRDIGGRAVEYIRILYRPEHYRFEMEMRRVESDDGKVWSSHEHVDLAGPPEPNGEA